jgi:hypothetical protein
MASPKSPHVTPIPVRRALGVLGAECETVEVTVEIDGRETMAGTLWVHERVRHGYPRRCLTPSLD